jgi:hypothetical protein
MIENDKYNPTLELTMKLVRGSAGGQSLPLGNGAVRTILSNQLYLGHTVTFKSGVISYKNPKQVAKPEDE